MTTPNAPETTTVVLAHLQDVARQDPAAFVAPRAVADAVGKGYSTVTAALRDLRDAGHVISEKRGAATVWAAKDYAPAMTAPDAMDDVTADHMADHGHAVVGDIDTTETATAVDLSGDALTLAGAGSDLPRRAETPAGPAVDDIEGDPAGPVSVYAETAASLGGPVTPAIPGQPVADDVDAPITVAPAGTTAWDAMEELMRDVTNPPARTPATVDLAPATATFGAGPDVHDRADAAVAESHRILGDAAPVSAPPAGAGLDDVLGFMTAVRPVSAAPAQTDDDPRPVSGAPRTSTARRGEADRRNDWGRGELAAAALAYVVAKGGPAKPSEVAKAINGFTGSVDFALKQMAKKGTLERVPGDGPATYRVPAAQ